MIVTYSYFLGLRNLDIITDCIRWVHNYYSIDIDPDNLPQQEEVYKYIFSEGKTDSVFQFESSGMKQMLRQFKPSSFEDIILLVAAYRPGPMQYIPEIIKVKHGKKRVSYLNNKTENILKGTYGSIIYQEQVMALFQQLAGYSLGQADIVRRYMSKKKQDMLELEKAAFVDGDPARNISGCVANGVNKSDALHLFTEMEEFAKYAFNKSHACAYAMVSYQTAYLKYYYPTEYMASVMNHSSFEKMSALCYDCRSMGIKILPLDINYSHNDFYPVIDQKQIRYGFKSVKGMGQSGKVIEEEQKNLPFSSFVDFLVRTGVPKDVAQRLAYSGAFDRLHPGKRMFLADSTEELIKKIKNRNSNQETLFDKKKAIAALDGERASLVETLRAGNPGLPDDQTFSSEDILTWIFCENVRITDEETEICSAIKKIDKERNSLGKQIKTLETNIRNVDDFLEDFDPAAADEDDEFLALNKEKELLGAYVSKHPLDMYQNINENTLISSDFKKGFGTVAGLITNLRWVNRKKDGAPMAFFTLEDTAGEIEVSVFAEAAAEYKDLIEEGNVVVIEGKAMIEEFEEKQTNKLIASKMRIAQKSKGFITILLSDSRNISTEEFGTFLKRYQKEDGMTLKIFVHSETEHTHYIDKKNTYDKEIVNATPPFSDMKIFIQNIKGKPVMADNGRP